MNDMPNSCFGMVANPVGYRFNVRLAQRDSQTAADRGYFT